VKHFCGVTKASCTKAYHHRSLSPAIHGLNLTDELSTAEGWRLNQFGSAG